MLEKPPDSAVSRREFLILAAGFFNRTPPESLKPILISVSIMFDRGAHAAKGLRQDELSLFRRYQEKASREYAVSAIHFDLHFVEGAYLRTQGYSEIPDKFLLRKTINLFVTDTLAYDIDRDRTGGCSTGPRPPGFPPDPFYKIFLGLKEARDTTLAHEYAHHFTLDTQRRPTIAGNSWADIRNDYWLWRQRHGTVIPGFRACANAEWAMSDRTDR